MKALLVSFIILFASASFGEAQADKTAKEFIQGSLLDANSETQNSAEFELPMKEGIPSIDELMHKKLDLVQKASKIEKIESAIENSTTSNNSVTLIPDRQAYRPLKDEDPKVIQASPPFSINSSGN